MARRGENLYKRKDGRWEGRYIKGRKENGKPLYGYIYGYKFSDVKSRLRQMKCYYADQHDFHVSFRGTLSDWAHCFMQETVRSVHITDVDIDAILKGDHSQYDDSVTSIVESVARDFVEDLVSHLRELEIDLRSSKAVFVGGGSILLKNQIEACSRVREPIIIEEIAANVIGYELLYAAENGA